MNPISLLINVNTILAVNQNFPYYDVFPKKQLFFLNTQNRTNREKNKISI